MTNKLIGLVEVCGSMAYKITGDAQPHSGMGKYESKDLFLSAKGQCLPADYEEVAAELHAFAQDQVMAAANYHANFLSQPAPETPPLRHGHNPYETSPIMFNGQEMKLKTPEPPPVEAIGKYTVVEKTAEKAPEKSAEKSASATAPAGPQAVTPRVIADRLKAAGMTADEIGQWAYKYHEQPVTATLTKAQYVEAFTKAEEFLKEHGIGGVRQALVSPPASSETTTAVAPEQQAQAVDDGPLAKLMPQVAAKFPLWPPDMVRLGAMWCADQVKDAGALHAFLIAAGLGDQAPPIRIEAYLAITRHLAMSAGTALLDYSRKSGNPLSMIEDEVSKIVGQPIRFASGLAPDVVSGALTQLINTGAKDKQ